MFNKEQMARLKKLDRLEPEAVEAAFKPRWNRHNFTAAAGRSNGGTNRSHGLDSATIPVKYKALIAVAVAVTLQCPYCVDVHCGNARRAGVTEAELAEAAMVAGAAVTHALHAMSDLAGEA